MPIELSEKAKKSFDLDLFSDITEEDLKNANNELENIVKEVTLGQPLECEFEPKDISILTKYINLSNVKIQFDKDALLENQEIFRNQDFIIVMKIKDIIKYYKELDLGTTRILLRIENVTKLKVKRLEKLQEKFNISTIECNYKNYSIENYKKIVEKINQIISFIEEDAIEIEKFIYIYNSLRENIEYDNILENIKRNNSKVVLSKSNEEYFRENNLKSNSLENGLLKRKAVASGYAEILKNILACVNIKSECVNGVLRKPKVEEEHTWNQVKIEDQWYNVDLALDAKEYIKGCVSNRPSKLEYCLRKDKEFEETHRTSESAHECMESYSRIKINNIFKKQNVLTKANLKKIFNSNIELIRWKPIIKEEGSSYLVIKYFDKNEREIRVNQNIVEYTKDALVKFVHKYTRTKNLIGVNFLENEVVFKDDEKNEISLNKDIFKELNVYTQNYLRALGYIEKASAIIEENKQIENKEVKETRVKLVVYKPSKIRTIKMFFRKIFGSKKKYDNVNESSN